MTCAKCDEDCGIGNECGCDCHDNDEDTQAVVFENQVIEYETDHHLPDGSVITKQRIMVTGRTTAEAREQFESVYGKVKP